MDVAFQLKCRIIFINHIWLFLDILNWSHFVKFNNKNEKLKKYMSGARKSIPVFLKFHSICSMLRIRHEETKPVSNH